MSDEGPSQKRCSVEKKSSEDDTPLEWELDDVNENIAKDNMEGIKRSSPRRKDPRDTGSVAPEKIDLFKRGKTKGDDDSSEEAEVGEEMKLYQSKSEDEEYVPEPPAKRRRLVRSVQESTGEDSQVKQSKHEKGKKDAKNAAKKSNSKKSKSHKKKARAHQSEGEFEVEKIVKAKILKNGKKEFLIRWKGFSPEHDTWEPESNVTCRHLVTQYFEENREVIDASDEGEKKSHRSKSKRRGSARASRSKKTDSGADTEGSAKGKSKKGKRNAGKSQDKGKKRQTRDRNAGAKTGKDEAEVSDQEKEGDAKTKAEKDDDETSQNRGSASEAGEKGEPSGSGSEDQREYEVERIVDVRQPKEGDREFLIKWRGYPNKFNSWESENNMNCSEKIEKFLKSMEQTSTERELRVIRKKTNRFIAEDVGRGRKMSLRLGKLPRKSYSEMD